LDITGSRGGADGCVQRPDPAGDPHRNPKALPHPRESLFLFASSCSSFSPCPTRAERASPSLSRGISKSRARGYHGITGSSRGNRWARGSLPGVVTCAGGTLVVSGKRTDIPYLVNMRKYHQYREMCVYTDRVYGMPHDDLMSKREPMLRCDLRLMEVRWNQCRRHHAGRHHQV
jgi:hypothetical protein